MKKWLTLILAMGLSFAPPALAAEKKVSQHAGNDIVCQYAEEDKKSRQDLDAADSDGEKSRTVKGNEGRGAGRAG